MRYYDLTTTTGKQSAINALNTRMTDIGERFGYDSKYYTDYKVALSNLVDGNMTESGLAARGKSVVDKLDPDDIQAMLSKPTGGKLNKQIRENIAREAGIHVKDVTDEAVSEYVDQATETQRMIDEFEHPLSDALAQWRDANDRSGPGGGKMTYAEIQDALRSFDAGKVDRASTAERVYQQHFGSDNDNPFTTKL